MKIKVSYTGIVTKEVEVDDKYNSLVDYLADGEYDEAKEDEISKLIEDVCQTASVDLYDLHHFDTVDGERFMEF